MDEVRTDNNGNYALNGSASDWIDDIDPVLYAYHTCHNYSSKWTVKVKEIIKDLHKFTCSACASSTLCPSRTSTENSFLMLSLATSTTMILIGDRLVVEKRNT